MAEWLKAHAWKACVRETVPWVRIPLSPPSFCLPAYTDVYRRSLNELLMPVVHGLAARALSSSVYRRMLVSTIPDVGWRVELGGHFHADCEAS
jgi:hypothetical protein